MEEIGRKWRMAEGIDLLNQEKSGCLEKRELTNSLRILEADSINQAEMNEKNQKEYPTRTIKLLETKPYSRNLIKEINNVAVVLVRYSGAIL